MGLLLLADPSEQQMTKYLDSATVFIAERNQSIVGVCALSEISKASYEIHNIAVAEELHGKGIGTRLLRHAINFLEQQQADSIIICTADTSVVQLHLYQEVGFKEVSRVKDYFLKHYPEPIFENGRQCRDRIVLKLIFSIK